MFIIDPQNWIYSFYQGAHIIVFNYTEHNNIRQAKGRQTPTAFPSKLSSPLMLHFKHQLLRNFLNTAEENFFSMKRLCLNPNKIVIVTLTGFTEVLFIRKGTFYFIFRRLIQIWLSTYEMDNTISFQPQKKLPKAESSCFSFLFFFNASNLFKSIKLVLEVPWRCSSPQKWTNCSLK